MKTYVKMNGMKFDEIERAVEKVKELKLEQATLDVHDENGSYIESQEISSEDEYQFFTYGIFFDKYGDESEYEWYGNTEVYYNTAEEAKEAISKAEKGRYKISKVYQTLSEYVSSEDIAEVVIDAKKVFTVWVACTTLGHFDDLDSAIKNADTLIQKYLEREPDGYDEGEKPRIYEYDYDHIEDGYMFSGAVLKKEYTTDGKLTCNFELEATN